MNGRERYQRAIKFAGPDRVPVMHRTIPGAARKYKEVLEELYKRFPSDVLNSPTTGGWFSFRWTVNESSGSARGAVDEWGCVWDSLTDDYLGQVIGHPIDTWEKLEDYTFPEPTVGIEGLEELVAVANADDHQHYMLIEVGTLWHRTNWLRGFENSLIDVLEDRPELYYLRDKIVDHMLQRIDILAKHREHIDGILVNDDWGTQQTLFIRPEYWRKVYKPAYKKIADAIHALGCNVHLHSDGATSAIFDDLIEIGFDELNPQMSCMNIEELGRRWGGKVCFRADMDRQYTLPFGTPDEVRAYAQRLYDAFGQKGGGYVGYGQVGTDVPLANVEAMLSKFYTFIY